MKYTGHLNNDIENEALMPGVLAERFPFSTRLLIKFERHYKIRNFGTSFVKAVNTNGGAKASITFTTPKPSPNCSTATTL